MNWYLFVCVYIVYIEREILTKHNLISYHNTYKQLHATIGEKIRGGGVKYFFISHCTF